MRPEQAFVGRRVIKMSGHGKGKKGTISRESDMHAGTIFIILDDENETRVCNPYEWQTEPVEKEVSSKKTEK